MNLTRKKLFLFGFVALLLVGIPASIYIVQQQQQTQSRAAKSTNITFSPESSAAAPIQKNVGDDVPLDVMIDPGSNLVSFVKLEIQYDPDKIATASSNAFTANSVVFPSVLEGPVYTPGKIAVTLSVGPDPTKAIQTKVKAATIAFKAIANTGPGTPTLVTYSASTQALSIGPNDQASENVLSSATPATIIIGGTAIPTTADATPTTAIPTDAPLPTDAPVPTTPPVGEPTAVPTLSDGGTPTNNVVPTCDSLAVDRETTGTAPFSLTFTANGTDTDGTVSKVTYNFGDGQVSDVTTGGGVGTATINTQISHTYNNPGSFQASAVLTDNVNGISDSANCTQTITVQAASGSATTAPSPAPSIAATGSTEVVMGIGAIALFLMVGGGLLFFIL